MSEAEIILASGSESRRRLIQNAGLPARAIKPMVDEDAAKAGFRAEGMAVRDQAMRLAELKALKISKREQGLVIGGDQMLALDGQAFDKPNDLAGARRHLEALSGRTHTLETALVVAENDAIIWRHLAQPRLTMRALSSTFVDDYINAEGAALLSTVGAYRLESLGVQLFTKIEGDYFSVLGLPLLPLLDFLRTRGVMPE